jgi:hypothetical protein
MAAHGGLVLRHQDPLIERRILGRRLQQPGHVAHGERLQADVLSFERAGPRHRVPAGSGDGDSTRRPFHVVVRRRPETELAVQAVCVGGVQHPAESRAGALIDHHRDDGLAQAAAAVGGQHVHVGQVGRPAVADRAGEADLRSGWIVHPDEPPGRGHLTADVGFGAPPPPVGLGG